MFDKNRLEDLEHEFLVNLTEVSLQLENSPVDTKKSKATINNLNTSIKAITDYIKQFS